MFPKQNAGHAIVSLFQTLPHKERLGLVIPPVKAEGKARVDAMSRKAMAIMEGKPGKKLKPRAEKSKAKSTNAKKNKTKGPKSMKKAGRKQGKKSAKLKEK